MKTRIGMITAFLVFATVPFALAQYRGEGVHRQDVGFGRGARHSVTVYMRATDIQRETFMYCMSATDAAHKLISQMPQDNSYWHGRHEGYDLSAVTGTKDQLQSAVTEMTTVHQQFLQVLSQDQDAELGPDISMLKHLQVDLNFEMSQLNEEMMAARPDPFRVSATVHGIGKTINEWRSEHKRIAKKLGMSKS